MPIPKGTIFFFACFLLSLASAGCRPNANSSVSKPQTQYRYVDSDANTAGPNSGDTSMEAPSDSGNPSTAELQKDQAKAAEQLKAHPNDPKVKKAFVAATDRYAMGEMVDPNIDRKVKYKTALELYNQVLKVDPSDQEAKNNSALIISIYHKLGKTPPS